MRDTHFLYQKTALVTGGSKGIGASICSTLSEQGALVIDASIDCRDSVFQRATSGTIYQKRTDVSSPQSVQELFDWIDANFPSLDLLINNAGIFVFKPLSEIAFEEWQQVMKVNLDGAFLCTKAALQRMLPKENGQIINIGSISGAMPLPNNSAYGTSKAALKMFTQLINLEYARQGIKATLLTLGAVATEFWENYPELDSGKMIRPASVAATILQVIEQNAINRVEEIQLLPPFRFFD